MGRRLRHSLAALFLALLLAGPVWAQQPPAQPPAPVAPAPAAQPQQPVGERSAPALQYTVAASGLILVLVIVCMPSRKA